MHGAPRQPTVPVSWWMGEMVTRTIGWVTVVPNLPRERLPPVRILAEVHLEYHNRCPRPALLAGEPLVQEEQVHLWAIPCLPRGMVHGNPVPAGDAPAGQRRPTTSSG